MTKQSTAARAYPWTTKVGDKSVTLRLMEAADKKSLLAFARSLPEDDLLFLSIDVTETEAADEWARNVTAGRFRTILAEIDGKLIGQGTLTHDALHWTRHIGEIMLLVSPQMRGKGIGNLLAGELFASAKELGLRKIVARMAAEQRGALQVFERLGFKAEALLADYVIDRKDRTHDLIVMSYDVTGLTEE